MGKRLNKYILSKIVSAVVIFKNCCYNDQVAYFFPSVIFKGVFSSGLFSFISFEFVAVLKTSDPLNDV